MLSKYKYHFILHFTIIIWGFTGVLGKHLDVSGMESMPIVIYRMLIGWTTLLIFMFLIKKSIKIDFKGLLGRLINQNNKTSDPRKILSDTCKFIDPIPGKEYILNVKGNLSH